MKCFMKKTYLYNQDKVLQNYGWNVWDHICDKYDINETFKSAKAADECSVLKHLTQKTKRLYISIVLNNVIAEYDAINEPQNCPLKKVNAHSYMLVHVEF